MALTNAPTRLAGQEYIYSKYDPAYSNSYVVRITKSPESLGLQDKPYTYLAKSIAFQGETLNLTRDDFTKNFKFSGDSPYSWVNTVTITWNETSFWDIKRFHDAWLDMFYDKVNFVYKTGNKERGVTFDIRFYPDWKYDYDGGSSYVNIILEDCLPAKTGDVNLGWTPTPSVVTHSINYYPKRVKITYPK